MPIKLSETNKLRCKLNFCFNYTLNKILVCFNHDKITHVKHINVYKTVQELFSLKGLTFWLENPTRRQSSCSCSLINRTMSATATDTGIRLIEASLLSCSVTARCCCKVDTIMSITAVSDRPMLKAKSNNAVRTKQGVAWHPDGESVNK